MDRVLHLFVMGMITGGFTIAIGGVLFAVATVLPVSDAVHHILSWIINVLVLGGLVTSFVGLVGSLLGSLTLLGK